MTTINVNYNICEKKLNNVNIFNEINFFIRKTILQNNNLTINFSINFENLVINTILKTICENIKLDKPVLDNDIANLINLTLENIDKKNLVIDINKDNMLEYNQILAKIKNEIDDAYVLIIRLCITVLQVLSLKLKQKNNLIT